uniref:Secreted protein n=2 Tax=Ciona intestinalis TaxID=7719 RepID=F6XLL3_CIOIN
RTTKIAVILLLLQLVDLGSALTLKSSNTTSKAIAISRRRYIYYRRRYYYPYYHHTNWNTWNTWMTWYNIHYCRRRYYYKVGDQAPTEEHEMNDEKMNEEIADFDEFMKQHAQE